MSTGRQITTRLTAAIAALVLTVTGAALTSAAGEPAVVSFGPVAVTREGKPVPRSGDGPCGFVLAADQQGPQVALMPSVGEFVACLREGESVEVTVPLNGVSGTFTVSCVVELLAGEHGEAAVRIGDRVHSRTVEPGQSLKLEVDGVGAGETLALRMISGAPSGESGVRWRELRVLVDGASVAVPLLSVRQTQEPGPLDQHPALRPAMEQVLVEWDWRLQDGIGTQREAVSYPTAVAHVLERGSLLASDLLAEGLLPAAEKTGWDRLRSEYSKLAADPKTSADAWEGLWRRVHRSRRRIALNNPLLQFGPLLFVKHVPGGLFSHQLTQYYGANQRAGGGLFVLERPAHSMRVKPLLAEALPPGATMQPAVSFDGKQVLFAYCEVPYPPPNRERFWRERFFSLYQVDADGKNLRRLTSGPYDDFAPCYLPGGKIIFTSTRREGFHRCGAGPCPVYTLTTCERDGSDIRTISWHETHDWDPAVLNDGRILYTRWDYVDRHAVHFQHLWTIRPDGSQVSIFYGNNTLNPIGTWEARAIPGSRRIMATAAAHHAMTAGSIILLDVNKGRDGLDPIARFTPDTPFPESESPVGRWRAPGRSERPLSTEAKRWPGHCYRSAHPLSEKYCVAAYSFLPLVGEPSPNPANMFGLYLVDAFGNKELLYRDLNISSLWPTPLAKRPMPPALPSTLVSTQKAEGTFLVQNVYESWTELPRERIAALRIIQVLPKTTPHANRPRVGMAHASPGKQILGTVPVEEDGSAYFSAPASTPLQFQALDSRGQAVQIMRSLTNLQPGEQSSCVGCHEQKTKAPTVAAIPLAIRRKPSTIEPAPDGANPLSYPRLVQPVLDKNCVSCHSAGVPKEKRGDVILTGEPRGEFTTSYINLVAHVPYPQWGDTPKPRTYPDQYGARASALMKKLLKGHGGVVLGEEDIERLATWMDANALFYGTFNPSDQKRQLRGERIEGPDLEY